MEPPPPFSFFDRCRRSLICRSNRGFLVHFKENKRMKEKKNIYFTEATSGGRGIFLLRKIMFITASDYGLLNGILSTFFNSKLFCVFDSKFEILLCFNPVLYFRFPTKNPLAFEICHFEITQSESSQLIPYMPLNFFKCPSIQRRFW
jgi:hypothetical protein